MPRGDFVTRNSFYEALCAGSIPVVMDADYFLHCAFSDVIDYSDFVRTIPEADFMGDETKNVLELLSGMHDRTAAVKSLHSLWEVRNKCCLLPAQAGFISLMYSVPSYVFAPNTVGRSAVQRSLLPGLVLLVTAGHQLAFKSPGAHCLVNRPL